MRDSVDVSVPKTIGRDADGEVAWSWPPDAEAKSAGMTSDADDGSKKARFPGRVRISRKTTARGRPDDQAKPVVTAASFFLLAGHGAASTRPSLRPCVEKICQNVQTGGWIRTARCWN